MAEAELLSAPARTGMIRAECRVVGADHRHHIGGWTPLPEQVGHDPEGRARMREEQLQARTEVVVALFAVA